MRSPLTSIDIGPALIVPSSFSPSTVSDHDAVNERSPIDRVVLKRSRSPLMRPSSRGVSPWSVLSSPLTLPSSAISSSSVMSREPRGDCIVASQVPETSDAGGSPSSSSSSP